MIDRFAVSVVNLHAVMSAAMQILQLFVRLVAHQFEQLRVLAEKMLPQVGSALGLEDLVVAIDTVFHSLEQLAVKYALEEFIPIAAPDDLDDMPACAAEDTFQLIDDSLVAAHRAVQPLQVAVHYKEQVVEFFPGGDSKRAQRIHLVGFAIPNKRPYLAVSFLNQVAV